MASKTYTPISAFWFVVVPAIILGVGYFVWTSGGFLGGILREVFGPAASMVRRFVGSLF